MKPATWCDRAPYLPLIHLFPPDMRVSPLLVDRYFAGYWEQLNLSRDEFLGLGKRRNHEDMVST